MLPERREHTLCNEHKFIPPDRQFHWCLSCCFWYTIVLQDVVHNQRDRSIQLKHFCARWRGIVYQKWTAHFLHANLS
jgi:hypothetical protein